MKLLSAGLSVALAGCMLTGCGESRKESCRDLFEKYYEVNLQAFVKTMPEADSAAARRKGEFLLNRLYEIDSTFVLKKGPELDAFIRGNLHLADECE